MQMVYQLLVIICYRWSILVSHVLGRGYPQKISNNNASPAFALGDGWAQTNMVGVSLLQSWLLYVVMLFSQLITIIICQEPGLTSIMMYS